jgi:amino-acid N-acetyltransferase
MTGLAVGGPRRARPADLESALALVRAAGLPPTGIEEHFEHFWTIDAADGSLAGIAGAERYGTTWLLRSVVVDTASRRQGIASALVAAVLREAGRLGAREVFLLTTDAHDFFATRGFGAVSRAEAPTALQASEELRACPNTATLMRLEVSR